MISFAHEMKHPHDSGLGTEVRNLTQSQNRAAVKGLEIIHVMGHLPSFVFFLKLCKWFQITFLKDMMWSDGL